MDTNITNSSRQHGSMEDKVFFPDLSYQLIGVLFAAHNALGRFAREVQYADEVERLFGEQDIAFVREFTFFPRDEYKTLHTNRADFLVKQVIILELKAKTILEVNDFVQVHRYLEAASVDLGILVNFREKFLRPRRIIRRGAVLGICDIGDHS